MKIKKEKIFQIEKGKNLNMNEINNIIFTKIKKKEKTFESFIDLIKS